MRVAAFQINSVPVFYFESAKLYIEMLMALMPASIW